MVRLLLVYRITVSPRQMLVGNVVQKIKFSLEKSGKKIPKLHVNPGVDAKILYYNIIIITSNQDGYYDRGQGCVPCECLIENTFNYDQRCDSITG